jgi:Flp pilus assembly protein CpaB
LRAKSLKTNRNSFRRGRKGGLNLARFALLPLIIAVGLGLFTLIRDTPPQVAPTPTPAATPIQSSVEVLIPLQDLEEGLELKPALFRKESRTAGELSTLTVVSGFDQISGAYAKSFIPAGHPLLVEHLSLRAPVNSVVPQIRVGFRAITIKLDRQTTNEGWARAGVRVDVLWADNKDAKSKGSIIAQNLRVLSSGSSVSPEFGGESRVIQNGESTVTLEVSSEDQKRLKLASSSGELRLLLRGDDDSALIAGGMKTSLEGVAIPGAERELVRPSQEARREGWVVIEGRRYTVQGGQIKPE